MTGDPARFGARESRPTEARLAALLDHLGLARVHLAARNPTDWQGFVARYPERVASLTLLCPQAIEAASLRPLGERVLVVSGDQGPGAGRVRAVLPELPQAASHILPDYAGLMWSDLAGERGAEIIAAMERFLDPVESRAAVPPADLSAQPEGEAAGITYRAQGSGPPLLLLPLELSPSQWDPLVPSLAAHHCAITLGGDALGPVASLEERGRSDYMHLLRRFLDALRIAPGETLVEIGCGSGVVMRELARRSAGANRLIGIDMNAYLLREARALAEREGLADRISLREGRAEALPLEDASVDVAIACTVIEEGDADAMLRELVRVARPGGRVGLIVRAIDMPSWVNLPLAPALKAKVDRPGLIGAGASPQGCADASLYTRLHALGLTGLDCFAQLVAVRPWQPRLMRYRQQILAALDPAEAASWRQALAVGEAAGTFFIAQPFHCAIGTKPG